MREPILEKIDTATDRQREKKQHNINSLVHGRLDVRFPYRERREG